MAGHAALDDRVLVLTPTGRDAALASSVLARASIPFHVCRDITALTEQLKLGAGVLMLAEETLGAQTFVQLTDTLRLQPSWSDVPIVFLTSAATTAHLGPATIRHLEALGNVTALERPVRIVTLLSTVQAALRARRRQYEVRDHLDARKRSSEERERLFAAEQAARAEIEAANRAKDDFLAMLSHELRTPLQSMLGWVRVLRAGRIDGRQIDRALEAIERNTRVQAQLIEDLLDVSRIVAGKLRVEPHPMALGPVLEAAAESVRATADAKHIRVVVPSPGRPVIVAGDAGRLQQVVWNLLSNAVKFTPEGGRIDLRLTTSARHAIVSVSDTGRGIPPPLLPTIFERFSQADGGTARAAGGLGLGLAIVRHLVELHGGTVEAASPGENMGAVFTVRIPLVPSDGASDAHRLVLDRPPHTPPARKTLRGVRVLVAEDNDDTRELLTTVLQSVGADVTAAGSAEHAITLMGDTMPDVLISDISMPGEDGYGLLRAFRAREHEVGRHVPALAVTAHARPEDVDRARREGFDGHLAKPVDPAQIVREIVRLLGRSEVTRARARAGRPGSA